MKGEYSHFGTNNEVGNVLVLRYRSTNPKMPGSGEVEMIYQDLGEGTDAHGFLQI